MASRLSLSYSKSHRQCSPRFIGCWRFWLVWFSAGLPSRSQKTLANSHESSPWASHTWAAWMQPMILETMAQMHFSFDFRHLQTPTTLFRAAPKATYRTCFLLRSSRSNDSWCVPACTSPLVQLLCFAPCFRTPAWLSSYRDLRVWCFVESVEVDGTLQRYAGYCISHTVPDSLSAPDGYEVGVG